MTKFNFNFYSSGFTFNDEHYVGFTGGVLYTWELRSFTMIGTLTAAAKPISCSNFALGSCSYLCVHQTDHLIYVWDIVEQAPKVSFDKESICPYFGPQDTIILLRDIGEAGWSVSVWDAATAYVQPKFSFSGLMKSALLVFKFNSITGRVVAGFNLEDDRTLTMVEVDWDTEQVVHSKTLISGEVKGVFMVRPLTILM